MMCVISSVGFLKLVILGEGKFITMLFRVIGWTNSLVAVPTEMLGKNLQHSIWSLPNALLFRSSSR